jgi:hypothetical protein
VRTVLNQQLAVADWLRASLPTDVRVGVHDTGSLRYVGGRPTYDLIGLTTPDAAQAWRNGSGSTFERMEHAAARPDYFAIYPDAFSIPYLAATDLFSQELFRVEVPDYVVASAGPVQGVWRADWRLADSGARMYQPDVLAGTQGLTTVDVLDVADLSDEAAHGLVWWHDVQRAAFPTEVRQMAYRVLPEQEVLDGGRLVTGGLAFEVVTEPGREMWLVARLHAQEGGAVRVDVDGQDVGRWAYPPVPGQWLETAFRVPSQAVTRSRTRIVLQVDTEDPAFRHFAPYTLWVLQGEPTSRSAEIARPVDVQFASGLSLVGFSLAQPEVRAGDVLTVTLFWEAQEPTDSGAKVFLHLYDADGNLGPQSDGWAYHGTRPPYTWTPEEVVTDPRWLALPAELDPGQYVLEVGLYNPDGSGRLPAYRDGVRQPEERVRLAVIQVQ